MRNGKKVAVVMDTIDGLDALKGACSVKRHLEVTLNGKPVRIPVRVMTPAVALEMELVLKEVMPPRLRKDAEQEEEYDLRDKDYLQQRAKLELAVACLTVWHCCEWFDAVREQKRGISRDEVVAFVCEQVPHNELLRTLAQFCADGQISVQERVSFT